MEAMWPRNCKTLLVLMWVIALKQWYSVDGRVGKNLICTFFYSCFVVGLGSPFYQSSLKFWFFGVCLKTKVSHCGHKATLVKLVTGQTISTHYSADWLLDVDLKQFVIAKKRRKL